MEEASSARAVDIISMVTRQAQVAITTDATAIMAAVEVAMEATEEAVVMEATEEVVAMAEMEEAVAMEAKVVAMETEAVVEGMGTEAEAEVITK